VNVRRQDGECSAYEIDVAGGSISLMDVHRSFFPRPGCFPTMLYTYPDSYPRFIAAVELPSALRRTVLGHSIHLSSGLVSDDSLESDSRV
jgi:hypothetical protein